jgi:hypothetical protein
MKQADHTDMFKKASESVCTRNIVLSPDPLSPPPSISSAMKTPENIEEDPVDLEPENKDIQIKYSSD